MGAGLVKNRPQPARRRRVAGDLGQPGRLDQVNHIRDGLRAEPMRGCGKSGGVHGFAPAPRSLSPFLPCSSPGLNS